ncbi:hypothetical protein [Bosea sp. PAMC 26642]|uniref:hypothetical protein n=1 Tax=Bosea sp. (strain PAMC 26642) TaxID=1792307 RepID=UPI00077014F7|nr:hypothetical protein [Bosea sp. PAMC 26642]AMJ60045.1 hypothetical protein AXW83_06795 [Bosea sp. PAMC 26642]
MTTSVIAPMIGMVGGALAFWGACWRWRRLVTPETGEVVIVGAVVAAFVGGFVGYKSFEWLGFIAS